ncbi:MULTISPECIES: PASTA domain-containing protein [Polaribacter]|uniref:Serine/threonine protein kinase n=1 Tax=Polaribacter butkevichii TaxID=218490 RepID=A0A2P6CBC7_9FLAO|nr:PASTA domain-containing protein [Polaribacter butkevichii]PQJ72213.1 serine/threonine protein kinase [Polaribacter butkevichii]
MSVFQFIKSKSFFIQVTIAIVGLLIFIFALKYWLGYSTNHDQKIQVPNLHKMSLENVENKLKELNLDFIVIDSASYNPDYPKKSVIEQSPEAGDFVKEKRKIYLTLNPSKYRDVTIPDLNGKTKRQAISHLRSIGFNIGTNPISVRDIGKDVVRGLRYNGKILNKGDKLPLNSIVDLVLGDGNGN